MDGFASLRCKSKMAKRRRNTAAGKDTIMTDCNEQPRSELLNSYSGINSNSLHVSQSFLRRRPTLEFMFQ